jgi:WD40 repeat protein
MSLRFLSRPPKKRAAPKFSFERRGTLRSHASLVTNVTFSPDRRRLASASSNQTVKLADAASRPGGLHPQRTRGQRPECRLQR